MTAARTFHQILILAGFEGQSGVRIEVTAGDLRLLFALSDDKTITEIAAVFGDEDGAVYKRLRRLRQKFGVRTTYALVLKAARLGVLDDKNRPK